jgi:hypothetical protein
MPSWKHIVRRHLAPLRLPPEREIEIVEELALHLEAIYDEALADGAAESEARARAMRVVADGRLLECELSRAEVPPLARAAQPALRFIERKGGMRMESLWQDLRFGARTLFKQPGFALIAVITLALGIGATTAIFTVVNAVLLHPFAYPQPEQLMFVTATVKSDPGNGVAAVSYPNFQDWQKQQQVFSHLSAARAELLTLTGVATRFSDAGHCAVAGPRIHE